MRSIGLRVRFLIGTIGFVVALGLAVIIIVQTTLTQRLLTELQRRGVSITKGIVGESIHPVLTEDMVGLQILINDRKTSDKDIEYIFILDSQGEVLAHTFGEGFPIDLKDANTVGSGQHSIQPLVTEEGVILDIAVPILEGGAGVVHVGVSEKPVKESVANTIRLIVGMIIAALVVGSGGAAVLAAVITKPILELAEAAKAVGGGDLQHKVRVRTQDEIGQLGVAFNEMITERKRAEEMAKQMVQRLQALSHRLVEIQEAERRHIARELHDEIGQALTGLRLFLEMDAHLSADAVRTRLDEAQALVDDLVDQVRDLSLDLRPAMLDHLGLLPALLWHFERYTDQTDVRVTFEHTGLDERFAPDAETAIYRIVQEALTNVARHAGVSEVMVRVWSTRGMLGVQIEDQGIGFDPDVALSSVASSGLSGIRERVALLDGQLTIESIPGSGARLTAELPSTDRLGKEEGR